MSREDGLRGHAYYLELAGRTGTRPWWVVVLLAAALLAGLAGALS